MEEEGASSGSLEEKNEKEEAEQEEEEEEEEEEEQQQQPPQTPQTKASRAKKQPKRQQSLLHAIPLSSVVKVFTVKSSVSYKRPWQKKGPKNSSGSGFIIGGKRILTNAHVVENFTTIMVRRHGSPKRYMAEVLCIGYQCDIALLRVQDEAFWEGHKPLEFGAVPQLQESVTCVGYPTGGDNISVTCGVVSRVDVRTFVNRFCSLLAVQIDAAINSGNSGGPVFQGTKVVGIAFSRKLKAQLIGHIIPVPVIQRFLTEYDATGRVSFCTPGLRVANMENPSIRRYYSMDDKQSGVLVTSVNPKSTFSNALQEEDILLSFDGVSIADDATIVYRGEERISWTHLIGMKYTGDNCRLTVLRQGKVVELEATVAHTPTLVPRIHGFDCFASYYVIGGLVFIPLSVPFLLSWYGVDWQKRAPSALVHSFFYSLPTKERSEIVILAQMLSSKATIGYTAGGWCTVLYRFNGQNVQSLKHLVTLVEEAVARYHERKQPENKAAEQQQQEEKEKDTEANAAQDSNKQEDEKDVTSFSPSQDEKGSCASPSQRLQDDFLRFDVGEAGTTIILDIGQVVELDPEILRNNSIAAPKSADLL
ncbi:putative Serine endopeptidase degp2 [Balamuthia mandrillaris]